MGRRFSDRGFDGSLTDAITAGATASAAEESGAEGGAPVSPPTTPQRPVLPPPPLPGAARPAGTAISAGDSEPSTSATAPCGVLLAHREHAPSNPASVVLHLATASPARPRKKADESAAVAVAGTKKSRLSRRAVEQTGTTMDTVVAELLEPEPPVELRAEDEVRFVRCVCGTRCVDV